MLIVNSCDTLHEDVITPQQAAAALAATPAVTLKESAGGMKKGDRAQVQVLGAQIQDVFLAVMERDAYGYKDDRGQVGFHSDFFPRQHVTRKCYPFKLVVPR